jgi:hypothetical protein
MTRGPVPKRGIRSGSTRKILLTLLVLGGVGSVAAFGTYSAFTGTTTNTGNSFSTGSVALDDNDNGVAMLSLTNAKPGDSDTSCIRIRYTGSLSSTLRLYGSISGTLAPYLTLTVTRGTDTSPSFDACSNFTADATDYNGNGAGVVYSGSLSSFPTSYATGIVDPTTATPATWATNDVHSYRFVITLQDVNAAQGQTGSGSFTWEVRNQ